MKTFDMLIIVCCESVHSGFILHDFNIVGLGFCCFSVDLYPVMFVEKRNKLLISSCFNIFV